MGFVPSLLRFLEVPNAFGNENETNFIKQTENVMKTLKEIFELWLNNEYAETSNTSKKLLTLKKFPAKNCVLGRIIFHLMLVLYSRLFLFFLNFWGIFHVNGFLRQIQIWLHFS